MCLFGGATCRVHPLNKQATRKTNTKFYVNLNATNSREMSTIFIHPIDAMAVTERNNALRNRCNCMRPTSEQVVASPFN